MSDEAADMVRAAKAARAQGERLGDRETWIARKPEPLDAIAELPPFPTEALPQWCGDFAEGLATATQVPADMSGTFVLGALAVALGGRVRVRVSEGHTEGVNLYAAVLAEPGTRKSPVHAACGAPLVEAERELQAAAAGDVVRSQSQRRIAEARLKEAEANAAKCRKAGERDLLASEAERAAEELAALEVLALPRLLAGDVTPERLIGLLAEHGGRLALFTGEDPIFGHLLGRYSKVPMIDPLLSAFSGEVIRCDRKNGPPLAIDRPALTIVLAVQPGVFTSIPRESEVMTRGLRDRFLLVVPPNRVGFRDMEPPAVPAVVRSRYETRLRDLAVEAHGSAERIVFYGIAARTRHVAWLRDLERAKRPAGRLASVVGWASKAEGICARIAGLLHVASGNAGDEITADTEERAIELMRYFEAHALVATDVMGADVARNDARRLLAWSIDFGARFNASDSLRAHRAIDATRQRAALALLERTGNMRRLPRTTGKAGGKPADAWEVHPSAVRSVSSRYPRDESEPASEPGDVHGWQEGTEETPPAA